MAVNFSRLVIKGRKSVEAVSQVLGDVGISPRCLEIELTESALAQNETKTIQALQQLKELGVRIVLDDFGTGYFSLYHLRLYPLDALKIDRSFVKDINTSTESAAITAGIIDLAHRLRLEVIAEGVETERQLEVLRQQGCDAIQGHLFSPAVPSRDIVHLLHGNSGQILA
jgi:EAL domain-containing protein (putative c-di-GMP-specific phosphodiesterase class I)